MSSSCGDVIVDPAPGLSDFLIVNNSDDTVFISYEVAKGFEELRTEIEMILSGNKVLIINEARLGLFGTPPPKPSDVFEGLNLYSDKLKTQEVYSQNPIVDSLWMHLPSNKYQDIPYLECILEVSM